MKETVSCGNRKSYGAKLDECDACSVTVSSLVTNCFTTVLCGKVLCYDASPLWYSPALIIPKLEGTWLLVLEK